MRAGEWCPEHRDDYSDCSFLHRDVNAHATSLVEVGPEWDGYIVRKIDGDAVKVVAKVGPLKPHPDDYGSLLRLLKAAITSTKCETVADVHHLVDGMIEGAAQFGGSDAD